MTQVPGEVLRARRTAATARGVLGPRCSQLGVERVLGFLLARPGRTWPRVTMPDDTAAVPAAPSGSVAV